MATEIPSSIGIPCRTEILAILSIDPLAPMGRLTKVMGREIVAEHCINLFLGMRASVRDTCVH